MAKIPNIAPLLNRFIPDDIAVKGLSKIDPKMKQYLNSTLGYGYSAASILSFLRSQFAPSQYVPEVQSAGIPRPDQLANAVSAGRHAQDIQRVGQAGSALAGIATGMALPGADLVGMAANMAKPILSTITSSHEASESPQQELAEKDESHEENPIKEESEELHDTIMAYLNQGHLPQHAGALIKLMAQSKALPHLHAPIKKLEKRHKKIFEDLVPLFYGNQTMQPQSASQQPTQQQAPQPSPGFQMPQPGTPEFKALGAELLRLKRNMSGSR